MNSVISTSDLNVNKLECFAESCKCVCRHNLSFSLLSIKLLRMIMFFSFFIFLFIENYIAFGSPLEQLTHKYCENTVTVRFRVLFYSVISLIIIRKMTNFEFLCELNVSSAVANTAAAAAVIFGFFLESKIAI